ncbi:MAG: hypothetical protein R3E95_15660 [Thiolinea sp.]
MSKDIKLNQRKRASLQQATVIIFMGIAAVIMLALLTYSNLDPGLFHRNNNHVGACQNMAGCKGRGWLISCSGCWVIWHLRCPSCWWCWA